MLHLRRAIRAPLLLLAFLWVVLEETIWRWARMLADRLARLPLLAGLERTILRLDPHVVLLLFLIPVACLLPLKLAAVWLIGGGHPIQGVMLLVGAKFIGTAVAAHLYAVAEPKLMTIPAFAMLRNLVQRVLAVAHAYLDASPTWQAALRTARRARMMARDLAARMRVALFGDGPTLIARARALRERWRHRT